MKSNQSDEVANPSVDYRRLINDHPDLICKWRPDGTLTFANETYCRYFGKSAKELIGKTCLDYIHPEDRGKLTTHIAQFDTDHTQALIDLRIVDAEGNVRYHQWIDKLIIDPETGQREFLSTGRDVTDL